MLKRYQVLLPDWLEENIQYFADKFDLSFSEAIRAEICSAILATVPKQFPEYKPGLSHDDIVKMMREETYDEMRREDVHRILSKIYFEARKATEYRFAMLKKKKKK
jgi:hypothetical protein